MYQGGCHDNVNFISVARSNIGTVTQFRNTKLVRKSCLQQKNIIIEYIMLRSNSLMVLKMFNKFF